MVRIGIDLEGEGDVLGEVSKCILSLDESIYLFSIGGGSQENAQAENLFGLGPA